MLLLAILLSCEDEQVGSTPDVGQLGPPLEVSAVGPVVGCDTPVTVVGANPGDRVTLFGDASQGAGPCAGPAGPCLNLAAPRRLRSAIADASGSATFSLPTTAPQGGGPFAQATAVGAAGARVSAVLDLTPLPAQGDADQDGLPNDELCTWGTDPQLPDTDGDGWDDYTELFVFGANPLARRDGAKFGRGVWFWRDNGDPNGAGAVVGDPIAEADTLTAMDSQRIRRIYGSYDWNRPGATSEIAAWHTRAHAARKTVYLLLSENTWIDPAVRPALGTLLQTRIVSYHIGRPRAERFDGVHLDIEPQGLPGWFAASPADRRQMLFDLLDTYQYVRDELTNAGYPLFGVWADLPVWFDNLPPALGGTGSVGWTSVAERDQWFADLCGPLRGVSLMPFERDNFGSVDSGVSWERANIPCEVRTSLEADFGATWPDFTSFDLVRGQMETAYGPLTGIDHQSWSLLRPALP